MKTQARFGLLPLLIEEFPRWLDYFIERCPFTRPEQLGCHLEAIELRRKHSSAAAAAQDPAFVTALYGALRAWGLGARGSNLRPLGEFGPALQSVSATLAPLERLRIDADNLDVTQCTSAVWKAIESVGVVENKAVLVAGSKTLHHLLPDLVPPMDRAYTRPFFGWHDQRFQNHQAECFRLAYAALVLVARRAAAARYVGTHPWHSSVSKVLDNGVVGMMRAIYDGRV